MKQSRPRGISSENSRPRNTAAKKRIEERGTAHYASSSMFRFLWAQIYAWRHNMRKFSSLVYPCHKADLIAG